MTKEIAFGDLLLRTTPEDLVTEIKKTIWSSISKENGDIIKRVREKILSSTKVPESNKLFVLNKHNGEVSVFVRDLDSQTKDWAGVVRSEEAFFIKCRQENIDEFKSELEFVSWIMYNLCYDLYIVWELENKVEK